MIEVKEVKVESPAWDFIGKKAGLNPADSEGFDNIFDFAWTDTVEKAQRSPTDLRREREDQLDSVKSDRPNPEPVRVDNSHLEENAAEEPDVIDNAGEIAETQEQSGNEQEQMSESESSAVVEESPESGSTEENPPSESSGEQNTVSTGAALMVAETISSGNQEMLNMLVHQPNAESIQQQLNQTVATIPTTTEEEVPIQDPQRMQDKPVVQVFASQNLQNETQENQQKSVLTEPLIQTNIPTETVQDEIVLIKPQSEDDNEETSVSELETQKAEVKTKQTTTVVSQTNNQDEKPTSNETDQSFKSEQDQRRPSLERKQLKQQVIVEAATTTQNQPKMVTMDTGKKTSGLTEMVPENHGKVAAMGKNTNSQQILGLEKTEATTPIDMQENIDRVIKAVRTAIGRGSSRIQIRLEPPELGNLRIEIKQNSAGMQLVMQASNSKTQQLLQQNSTELRAVLEARGLGTTQIDIQLRLDLRNEQNTDTQQDSHGWPSESFQQGQSQEQGFGSDDFYDSEEFDNSEFTKDTKIGSDGPVNNEGKTTNGEVDGWSEMEFVSLDVKV